MEVRPEEEEKEEKEGIHTAMRKNTSVTFTDTTKLGGTTMGMGRMDGGGEKNANATSSVGLTSHAKSHVECNKEDDHCPGDGHF